MAIHREVETINISRVSTTTNLFYLFFHGGKAAIIPFLTLFFRLLGLNALEAGTIIAAKTLTGLLWAPLWARCAHGCNRHRMVLILSMFMMMATYLAFPALYTQIGTEEDCHPLQPNSTLVTPIATPTPSLPMNVSTATMNDTLAAIEDQLAATTQSPPNITEASFTMQNTTTAGVLETTSNSTPGSEEVNEEQRELLQRMVKLLKARHMSPEEAGLNLTDTQLSVLNGMLEAEKEQKRVKRTISYHGKNWTDVKSDLYEKVLSIRHSLRGDRVLLFLVLLAIMVGGEIFASPVEKVADDAWFDFLNRIDDLERYGQQRFWGSVSFVLVPVCVTLAVDYTPCFLPFHLHHYLLHFYVFVIMTVLAMLVACWYPVPPPTNSKYSSKICKGLRAICSNARGFFFSATLLLTGMVYASYHNFLFWQIQDMGGRELIMGLCVSLGAFSEIPMLMFSARIVKKMGHSWVVSLSLLVLSLRLLYYAFIPSALAIIPIELTHGITHTALWFAILSFEDFNVGAAVDRSIRSILSSFYFGIGFSAGSVLSGFVFDTYGPSYLFIGCSAAVGVWFLLFSLVTKCLPKKEKVRYIKLLQSDSDNSEEEADDWLEMAMKNQ